MAMRKTIMWNHTDYCVCMCACMCGWVGVFLWDKDLCTSLIKVGYYDNSVFFHKECFSCLKALRVLCSFTGTKQLFSDNLDLRENPGRFKIAVTKTKGGKKCSDESYAIHYNELTGDGCCIYMPTAFNKYEQSAKNSNKAPIKSCKQWDGGTGRQREDGRQNYKSEELHLFFFFFEGQEKNTKFMVFRPFELNPSNKEITAGSSGGSGSREKGSQKEVKKKCCVLGSLSLAAWGHLRDWRLNYPAAPAARRIRRTRGEDKRS